jgi:toxin HigB-1
MIQSFKDKDLEKLWITGNSKKINLKLFKKILMKLDSMDAAACIDDLRNPPGNNLHQLQGKFTGCWAISINGPWCLVFKLRNSDIYDVVLLQYH